jgi:MFS family permease
MAACGLKRRRNSTEIRNNPGRKPFFLEIRSSRWFILTAVSLGVFSDIFLYGVIVPVMPYSLVERIGVDPRDVQHYNSVLLAVYGAGLLVTAPLFGWLADQTQTRRSPLLFGLIMLTASTAILCVGSSMTMLVIGRLMQGISGAMVWTVGLALLVDTIGPEHLGQAMGMVTVALAMGILIAPLLGGVVYEKGGYYAVFEMSGVLVSSVSNYEQRMKLTKVDSLRYHIPLSHDRKANCKAVATRCAYRSGPSCRNLRDWK